MSYVLVAEDDPYIQLMVRRKLEGASFAVRSTADGDQVMAMISTEKPLIVLLDVMLPGRTGLDICQQIKRDLGTGAPPVIIISARGRESDVDAGMRAGADDYLIKPFSPKELLDLIHQRLG
ncbi:MAG TPA: response regulator [Aggregatilineales bacterium]|nr:response regulator [Anaerolineales bacterium]HRE46588.1 response regulator [Aggregatilineales bacterium]